MISATTVLCHHVYVLAYIVYGIPVHGACKLFVNSLAAGLVSQCLDTVVDSVFV